MITNIEKYNEKLYDKLYMQSRKFSELIHDPGIESYIKSIMSNGISGRIGKDEFKSKCDIYLSKFSGFEGSTGCFLFDGYGWGQAFNIIHIWFFHDA